MRPAEHAGKARQTSAYRRGARVFRRVRVADPRPERSRRNLRRRVRGDGRDLLGVVRSRLRRPTDPEPRRWTFIAKNLPDLGAVALPMLRPLRSLRLVTL